ncbi:MAG: heme transport system permease protein [Abditibacteriota bacterium]|nr:heme transport system permease protein [Abditibacteriota bacterium]
MNESSSASAPSGLHAVKAPGDKDPDIKGSGANVIPEQNTVPLLILSLLCALLVLAALVWGAPIPFSDLWSNEATKAETARRIFLELRPPRILAGLLVGASLATAGAALQSVFRNPLAEPYLLGVSSGGALGAAIALWLGPALNGLFASFGTVSLFAFVGSLGASVLVYRLGQSSQMMLSSSGAGQRASLLLTGVAVSALLSAVMSLVVTLSSRLDIARQMTFWLLGGLAGATLIQTAWLAASLVIGGLVMLASARDLDALQVGDEEASSLGVEIERVHRRLLLAAALMSASAVATAGLIGFIGLLAPHLARLVFGRGARTMLPAAALLGAMLLCGCDALARSIASPLEIPVGILTAILGVPLWIALMRRQ